jgi:hypothetical protein
MTGFAGMSTSLISLVNLEACKGANLLLIKVSAVKESLSRI